MLNGRHEDLVECSCCSKVRHPDLTAGVGSNAKVPKLLEWKCVRNFCCDCGVTKLNMTKCDMLANDKNMIDVMEWINAPQQGY